MICRVGGGCPVPIKQGKRFGERRVQFICPTSTRVSIMK